MGARYVERAQGKPARVVLPFQVTGFVPFRPIGKSHFVAAPWTIETDGQKYIPSDMSEEALKICLAKYPKEVKPYTDEELSDAFVWLRQQLMPLWSGCKVRSLEEAIELCDLSKGSGYPFHYAAPSKEEALDKFGDVIGQQVAAVLTGDETVDMPSCLTLKDELRTEDRVKAHKTRGFNASNFVHLLASKMLFSDQDERLHAARGKHPITLGISVPGDEYVAAVLGLGDEAYDADGDGYDLNVNLGLIRVIREVRKSFLPEEYFKGINLLYDTIYCGETIAAGVIYRLICQKSGWAETGDDNSLHLWLALYISYKRLGSHIDKTKNLINGDDLASGIPKSCGFGIKELQADLARNGVKIAFNESEPRDAKEITFLSHHVAQRFILPFGDILVAAGNRDKLLSSVNYVKTSDALSFEESCLAHLLGLRLCLWPWRSDFLEIDELIDRFLAPVHKSDVMIGLLKARLTEEQIALMHLSISEGGFCFSPRSPFYEVDQVTYGLIKNVIEDLC